MSGNSGGVGAAFGFRYQYLISVEVLLELYSQKSTTWFVDIDPISQDSADIAVYLNQKSLPDQVIQVKASLPESSTTIGVKATRQILDKLKSEHPGSNQYKLVTNRRQTSELQNTLKSTVLLASDEYFDIRNETLYELTESLLQRISKLRSSKYGGTGRELFFLLLRQLIDRVHEAGSYPKNQRLTYEDIRLILEGTNPLLSEAIGARTWGKCVQVPSGDFIERNEFSIFLNENLPAETLYEGRPKIAVLKGLSGTGKSSIACLYAQSLLEKVAFVIWLDATSDEILSSQIPTVLQKLGVSLASVDQNSQNFVELLAELPVPWLLILDGASSMQEVDSWVPRSGYGQVVITTQDNSWPSSYAPVAAVDAFTELEARQFLANRLGQPVESWAEEQLLACDRISRSLAWWPLALELAISWIVRRGGSVSVMEQFAERVDRLDLDDKNLLPHGYPHTANQIVLSHWQELSKEAQLIINFLLLMGGKNIPSRVLLDAFPHGESAAKNALETLYSAAFIQIEITDSGDCHEFDENVTVHGFIHLILDRQEAVSIEYRDLKSLLVTNDKWVQQLIEEGRFREGSSLVRSADVLLMRLVSNSTDKPGVLVAISSYLHNLAQLAFVVSQNDVAFRLSNIAFNIRDQYENLAQNHVAWIQMQLQTLASIAMISARLNKIDEINNVGSHFEYLLNQYANIYLEKDTYTIQSIRMIRDVLKAHSAIIGDITVLEKLDNFLPQELPNNKNSIGQGIINKIQLEMATALNLVEHSAWDLGTSVALVVANQALEYGALVNYVIDELLDIAQVMLTETLKRPMNTPPLLINSTNRLVIWIDENSETMDANQEIRYSILKAFTDNNPSFLKDIVQQSRLEKEHSPQLNAWFQLAEALAEYLTPSFFQSLYESLPSNIELIHSINGGGRLNVWWQMTDTWVPELWFHAPDAIRVTSTGKFDPTREEMERAGLQEIAPDMEIGAAAGWSVSLIENSIKITDGSGIERVITDNPPEEIISQIFANGGLILAYGDLPLTSPEDKILCGWIPISPDIKENISTGFLKMKFHSSSWWKKIFFWRS